MRKKIENLIATHGVVAVVAFTAINLTIFAVVLCGFALAIHSGFDVESTAGTAGTWAAAYVATKVTQPIRLAVSFALTLLVAPVLSRARRRGGGEASSEGPPPVDVSTTDATG